MLGAKNWLDWIGMAAARDETAGDTLRDVAGVFELPQIDYLKEKFGEPHFDLQFVCAPSAEAEEENRESVDEW